MQAIATHGPGITMADVAAAAGVTKPVLYRHFDDKGDLTTALAHRYAARLRATIERPLRSRDSPRDLLARTIDAYLEQVEKDPALYEFLVHRAAHERPDTARALSDFVHQLAGQVADVFREEFGRLGRSVDRAEAIAHGLVGMVQSTGEWWLASDVARRPPRHEVVATLVDLVWEGLARNPPARRADDPGPAA